MTGQAHKITSADGCELLEKILAPALQSEQLHFDFTRLPVILAAYSVFLKSWPIRRTGR